MKNIKVWPHTILVVGLAAVIAGVGGVLYSKHEQTVQAEALPNAARIQRVDGEVALSNNIYGRGNEATNVQWVAATPNEPFSVGDRIYTREGSRCALAFNGRNFARLDPNTALDAVTLTDGRTQLALRDGSALFDVGYLAPGELFEVGTPYGAVDFNQPGFYQVAISNDRALISVFNGLAQVVGRGGSGQISKGEVFTLLGQAAAEAALSRIDHRNAGYLVDDYYHYQYPNTYDGRYLNYDAYLNDPFYYDPYRSNASYRYVSYALPGVDDLDYYGDWQNVTGYGNCWRPRVDAGWTPYQQGYWFNDYPYGPTWVSAEPWGYAPYHYGRWAFVGNQWFWIPEGVNTTPRYSPALVAFVPLAQNEIGWVPLGPGDPYAMRYYDESWQPHYLTRVNVVPTSLVNYTVPGAVTVVPLDYFGRPFDSRVITRVDPRTLAQVRPTLDPLTLTPLRNAVMHSAWGRGKIDLPPGIAKKLHDTPVVVGTAPLAPPFRRDLAKALRVEPVPDRARQQKLKVGDERNGPTSQQADAARRQQIASLAAETARGNRDARRQMQQLEREQRMDQINQQRAQAQTQRRAIGPVPERVGQPAKPVAAPRAQPEPRRIESRPAPGAIPRAQPEQRRLERKPPPQAQPAIPRAQPELRRIERRPGPPPGQRVEQQARPAAAPQPQMQRGQQAPPQRTAAPQQLKHEAKPPSQGAQKSQPAPAQSQPGKGKRP